jgi:hypothetical protein
VTVCTLDFVCESLRFLTFPILGPLPGKEIIAMKCTTCAILGLLLLAAAPATAGTIGTLAFIESHGNSVTVGDKTFSNFSLGSSAGPNTGGGVSSAPGTGDVTVSISVSGSTYNVLFSGFSLTADGFADGDKGQADMTIAFDVSVNGPAKIDGVDLTVTGGASGNAHATVDETVTYAGGTTALSATGGGPQQFGDVVPPASSVHVIKDANVLAVGVASAHISAIEQSFHQTGQVPEIDANIFASALTLLLGCVAVLLGRRKHVAVCD